jgi:cold shock CspA family protein
VPTGILKNYNFANGWGFITADNPDELPNGLARDVFVHVSAFQRAGIDPCVGDAIEFKVVPGREVGKLKAENLRLLDDAADAPVQYGA